jgi:hypothetical protein
MTRERSFSRALLVAILGIAVALLYGLDLLGTPLRLVHVLTLVAASMGAGAGLGRAVTLRREERKTTPPVQ